VRGIAIEFRNHLEHGLWRPFWDAGFAGASALLAVFFGAALGNVVRGVPLDSAGYFFLPLWTNFQIGPQPGILDWYTILTGVAALAALTLHGALWLTLKTGGELAARARRIARLGWWAVALLTVAITAASFQVQPHLLERFREAPWGFVFPVIALAGLMGIKLSEGREMELMAFLSSAGYITGMLTSAAFGLYPYVLPATGDKALGLTIQNTASAANGLRTGLVWWIPGMALMALYFVFVYRHFAGKVRVGVQGY
jgi:cytochrome d ubiquinol oxidase subunit II